MSDSCNHNRTWSGPADRCDACSSPLGSVMSDARDRTGRWGLFCHSCAATRGCRYGTGLGRRYRRCPACSVFVHADELPPARRNRAERRAAVTVQVDPPRPQGREALAQARRLRATVAVRTGLPPSIVEQVLDATTALALEWAADRLREEAAAKADAPQPTRVGRPLRERSSRKRQGSRDDDRGTTIEFI